VVTSPRSTARTAPGRLPEIAAPVAAGDAGLSRIVTWPNAVTVARLALVPVYVWLLFATPHQVAAGLLLGTLGATDWIDGYLARRLRQVTTLGKVLDPIADRVLVFTAVTTSAVFGAVPWWFAIATLAREVVVSGAVLLLASLGAATWQTVLYDIAWPIAWIGLTLAWIATVAYVRPAREALSSGRSGRTLG